MSGETPALSSSNVSEKKDGEGMFIEVTAILISLGLLMFLAYRGFPVIVIAPIVTLLAVALSGGLYYLVIQKFTCQI